MIPQNKIDNFDLVAWLSDRGIGYTEGPAKNVGTGWTEITCPFPSCSDPSQHLGVSPERRFNCWRCGTKGDLVKLISTIDDCSYKEAISTIEVFQQYNQKELKREILKRHDQGTNLLQGFQDYLPEEAAAYLEYRGYDPSQMMDKYGILTPYPFHFGKYKFRIIIPITQDRKVVNFTARDITNVSPNKYRHCPNDLAIIPMKDLFYNTDNITRDTIVINEGPMDVWRMGDNFIASMGIEVTGKQLLFLKGLVRKKRLRKIFIMFDAEELAQKKAKELAFNISVFCPSEVLEIESGDPGGLSEEEATKIRREIWR